MGESSGIQGTRDLKKICGKILQKVHDLEIKSRRKRAAKVNKNGEFIILDVLNNLRSMINMAFKRVVNVESISMYSDFIKQFNKYIEEVEKCCNENRNLDKRFTSNLLKKNTRLFNQLISNSISVDISPKKWADTAMSAIELWGDDFSIYYHTDF